MFFGCQIERRSLADQILTEGMVRRFIYELKARPDVMR
jgi:hypothetical protein